MSAQHNKTYHHLFAAWNFLIVFIASLTASVVMAQPSSFADKIFFYNDIYHFVGKPYRSPSFADMHTISQPFLTKCSNLNRIIIPFFLEGDEKTGKMRFNLYQVGKLNEPVFLIDIDAAQFPAPAMIGTHRLPGVLYPIWIPPLADSANTEFIWEIVADSSNPPKGIGIYLTDSPDAQLQPVLINGMKNAGSSTFFSYCQYRFEWGEIFKFTGQRLWREKYFVAAFLILTGGILFLIPRMK
jgi:hypothetical protein